MALNPDEIVNKRFSATKFRQGYDEEQVDEFLDEIASELRRLISENEELTGNLSACEDRVAGRGGGSRPVSLAKGADTAPAGDAVPEAAAGSVGSGSVGSGSVGSGSTGVESATGVLALAQRLHDEHVASGRSEGAKLLAAAREQASRLLAEAQEKERTTLGALQTQAQGLERTVEDLRSFEREYRSRLKAYLEGQLTELGAAATTSAQPTPAAKATPQVPSISLPPAPPAG